MIRRVFVDTNVLVYRSSTRSIWYGPARRLLEDLTDDGARLCASPQVVREFMAAMSRSADLAPGDGAELVDLTRDVFAQLQLLDENFDSVERLYQLIQTYPQFRSNVHDANIAATMLAHDVTELLTHNTKHFEPLQPLITILPLTE